MNDKQAFDLDTGPFSKKQGVKPQSVRKRLCETGSYFGVKPIKLKNGRLKWPDVQVIAE